MMAGMSRLKNGHWKGNPMATNHILRGKGWRGPKGPQAENKSGFRATGHRVLLLCEPIEEKTASGIVLQRKTVEAEKNLSVTATVIEVGLDCWNDKEADYCAVGDKVLIGLYTGKFHTSHIDGKEYRFLMDLDIITPILSRDDLGLVAEDEPAES